MPRCACSGDVLIAVLGRIRYAGGEEAAATSWSLVAEEEVGCSARYRNAPIFAADIKGQRKVTAESQNRIYVKWVRSGIGFSHRQKGMIRSLGLKRLNQVVERPDTPQVRGLVVQLAHLVEVVSKPEQPAWKSTPEHMVRQPQPAASVEPASDVSSSLQPASQQPSQAASDEGTTQPETPSEEIAAGSTSPAHTEPVKTESAERD